MDELADLPTARPARTTTGAGAAEPIVSNIAPELAIIVPTFNEAENVELLVDRLDAAVGGIHWEAIFVDDDSPDGTGEIVDQIAKQRENIRCIRRVGCRGLASACIEGAACTEAPYIAVIDADLQHDEKLLPQMLTTIKSRRLDVVVASRFMANGGTADWQRSRVWLSHFAGRLARCAVKAELSDPMSGFFLIERNAFADAVPRLSGRGFKLLLDILASSPRPLAFTELPYCFRRRAHGRSKLDGRVAFQYLALLVDKIVDRMARRADHVQDAALSISLTTAAPERPR